MQIILNMVHIFQIDIHIYVFINVQLQEVKKFVLLQWIKFICEKS